MTTISRPRWHAIAAAIGVTLAASAVTFGAISGTAQAATDHVATATTDTTYLQDALGLPTNTIVEPVTYDRFQWLLQQGGQFAFIIGTASDTNFQARAVEADAAARAA